MVVISEFGYNGFYSRVEEIYFLCGFCESMVFLEIYGCVMYILKCVYCIVYGYFYNIMLIFDENFFSLR